MSVSLFFYSSLCDDFSVTASADVAHHQPTAIVVDSGIDWNSSCSAHSSKGRATQLRGRMRRLRCNLTLHHERIEEEIVDELNLSLWR